MVVFYHALHLNDFFPGRGMVWTFFAISGYVIALSNQRPPDERGVKDYWKRRAVRLVPLYVIAVLFTFAVTLRMGLETTGRTWVIPFFFAQNYEPYGLLQLPVIRSNGPLWSLNYEVVFYAAFLLVWRFAPRVLGLGIALFVGGCGLSFFRHGVQFLGGYSLGFLYFLVGVFVAWSPIMKPGPRRFPFVGILLLFSAASVLQPAHQLFLGLGLVPTYWSVLSPFDLDRLPLVFVLLAGTVGRYPSHYRLWCLLAASPILVSALCALSHPAAADGVAGQTAAWFAVAGTLLLFVPTGRRLLLSLGSVGSISYAIYLFHQPILWLFRYEDSDGWVVARVIAAVATTVTVAALLEHHVQPRMARAFRRLLDRGEPRPR